MTSRWNGLLLYQLSYVRRSGRTAGFEPATHKDTERSTKLSYRRKYTKGCPVGFEPTTSAFTVRRSYQLSYGHTLVYSLTCPPLEGTPNPHLHAYPRSGWFPSSGLTSAIAFLTMRSMLPSRDYLP